MTDENLIKKLILWMRQVLKITKTEYVDYIFDRKWMCEDNEIKTNDDAWRLLHNIETNDEYEQTVRESGYVAGYSDAIVFLEKQLQNK